MRPLLQSVGIRVRFGERVALQIEHFAINRGEVVALVGPSGSGKTTFLKTLNLVTVPERGRVYYDGRLVLKAVPRRDRGRLRLSDWIAGRPPGEPILRWGLPPEKHRMRFGMVFQELNLWPTLSMRDNIAGPLVWLGADEAAAHARASEVAAMVGVEDLLDRYPSEASGGQRQRVAIARALAGSPSVLLLDEITSALDPELVSGMLELIGQLAAGGTTMVIVTHHLRFASQVASRMLFLADGRTIADQAPQEMLRSSQPTIRRFVERLVAVEGEP